MQLHIGNFSAVNTSVRDIDGHRLSRRLQRGLSATFRALIAYELESGGAKLHHLTRKQSVTLVGANSGYVGTVSRLTPHEREQVANGILSLAAIHNQPPTDVDIDRIVTRIGLDRVMAALDRLTRPIVETPIVKAAK